MRKVSEGGSDPSALHTKPQFNLIKDDWIMSENTVRTGQMSKIKTMGHICSLDVYENKSRFVMQAAPPSKLDRKS